MIKITLTSLRLAQWSAAHISVSEIHGVEEKLASSWFSLNLDMWEWNAIMLELFLVEDQAHCCSSMMEMSAQMSFMKLF